MRETFSAALNNCNITILHGTAWMHAYFISRSMDRLTVLPLTTRVASIVTVRAASPWLTGSSGHELQQRFQIARQPGIEIRIKIQDQNQDRTAVAIIAQVGARHPDTGDAGRGRGRGRVSPWAWRRRSSVLVRAQTASRE